MKTKIASLRVALLAATLVLVGCDHATKNAAKSSLEGASPRPVIGRLLELQYRENRDIGFELLRWMPDEARRGLLMVVGALAVTGLTAVLLRRRVLDLTTAALVLLLAGGAGNYADRVFRGYVVDFIHLSHWPVFNVADSYLVIAVVLLALRPWLERRLDALRS